MKELKDYLHLYKNVIAIGKNGVKYTVVGMDENVALMIEKGTGKLLRTYANNLKPFLRPLSSATEDERMEWQMFGELSETGVNSFKLAAMEAEGTKYLLSKHFDLFGLIESGLAIDATKTQTGHG